MFAGYYRAVGHLATGDGGEVADDSGGAATYHRSR